MAEDPLEAEDVTTVRQKRPRKRMAKDVGRTARLQSRPGGKAVHQLIETSRGQSACARAGEERIVIADTAPMAQRHPEGLASSSTDRHDSFSTTLPEHAASALGQVHVSDTQRGCFAHAYARIQQQKDDRAISLWIAGALNRPE